MSNHQRSQITQPTRKVFWASPPPPNRRGRGCCLAAILIPIFIVFMIVLIAYIGGSRTNILVLGLDSRESNSNLGRSDTMILTSFSLRSPYLGMLSIPRDLWVSIPENGENRINTAHFFGEIDNPGSGPQTAMKTVSQNFDIDVDYYISIHFLDFLDLVDLLDGVVLELPVPMSGYEAGTHQVNGEQALAFVRDRSGSDDFYRMKRAQIFLIALWKRILEPEMLERLPNLLPVVYNIVDTDMPFSKWGYLVITLLMIGQDDIDARTISREFTNPFTTTDGAQVLAPNWDLINPMVDEMFEK